MVPKEKAGMTQLSTVAKIPSVKSLETDLLFVTQELHQGGKPYLSCS